MFVIRTDLMWVLPALSIGISLAGQIPQIVKNFRLGNTGALSLVSQGTIVLGCVARLFTTFQLIDDFISLASCFISTGINVVLLMQIWRMAPAVMEKTKEKTR